MQPSKDTKQLLSENLRKLMQSQSMSARELAKKSGVSPRMIAYILDKNRAATIEIVSQLARAFRTTPSILLGNLSDADVEHLAILADLNDDERAEVSRYASYLISNRDRSPSE